MVSTEYHLIHFRPLSSFIQNILKSDPVPSSKCSITPFSWVSSTIFISILKFITQIIKEILKRTGHVTEPFRKLTPTTWTIKSVKAKPLLQPSNHCRSHFIETSFRLFPIYTVQRCVGEIMSKALPKSEWTTSNISFLAFLLVTPSTLGIELARCNFFVTHPFGYSLATH